MATRVITWPIPRHRRQRPKLGPFSRISTSPVTTHRCWKCDLFVAKDQLQDHMNTQHPGWDTDAIHTLGLGPG